MHFRSGIFNRQEQVASVAGRGGAGLVTDARRWAYVIPAQ